MKNERRIFWRGLIFVGFFMTVAFVSVGCAADTYTVCPGGGCDYTSIQAAVNAASSGDTLEVHSGTYYENVNVNKSLILKGVGMPEINGGMLSGHQFDLLVNDPSGDGSYLDIGRVWIYKEVGGSPYGPTLFFDLEYHVSKDFRWLRIYMDTDNDSTTGFSINGIGADYRVHPVGWAIGQHSPERWESDSGTWDYLNIWSWSGFSASCPNGPEGADKRYNINFLDSETGFQLIDAATIRLVFESLNGSTIPVVGDDFAPDSGSVELNAQDWKTDYKKTLIALNVTTDSCIIDGFKLTRSDEAVAVYSDVAQISNNTIIENIIGIHLYSSDNVTISDNAIVSNELKGILIENSQNGIIKNNNISKNPDGIKLLGSYNNILYNNYFNNTNNVYDDGDNIWNITKTQGTNIIGGSWLGGNYWSDYVGEDTDRDGLGDTLLPYNSSGGIQNGGDWLPLVMAEEEPYSNVDVGVTSNITLANSTDLVAYLPPEYDGIDISDAVVLNVDVTDDTPGNPADDAYTDITITVGAMDIATCKVFKAGMAFLPEVDDVTALPTVDGEPAFSRDVGNNTVTIRLYVGDPLLAVLPPAELPIFDTGEGTYPSISGTFTGTITPSRNLTVSTLYTYHCEGTGGHTKSIELYENVTLLASGVWDGYQGDWHNITLSSEVTLLKDNEYRYAITTGSYPQVIHASSKDVTGGTITCEEFVDVNGKTYLDWMPAIKLD